MKFRKKKFANFADRGKKILALTLAAALSVTGSGVESLAAKKTDAGQSGNKYYYLEKATMPEEIQKNDVFYVATTSAELREESEKSYVLTVGRGGEAKEASHVTVKLSDGTAKYGEDYTVRRMEDADEVPVNPDSVNLFELIEESDYEGETPYSEEDMKKAAEQIVEETKGSAAAYQEEKKSTSDNPLQQAKEELTGISSDREAMTSSGNDMIETMSQISNLLTEAVAGTTLTLDFSPGEKEKEIVITPKDNRKSDGDRFFYLVLSEPSEGMKNSSISESIFTIKDDEPEVKATVSFDAESFRAEDGEVKVRLLREGAITQTVAVHMTSKDGSAKAGENYEGVDSEVVFPFGVKERNITLTAKSDGLKEDADYTLLIKESSGAVTGKVDTAKVVIPKEPKKISRKKADRGKKISDVRLGDPITNFSTSVWDIDLPGYTWKSYSNLGEKGAGKSSFSVTEDNQIYLYGHDDAAGDKGNGIVQANSKLVGNMKTIGNLKDGMASTYDGVRINWRVHRSSGLAHTVWSVYASEATGTTDVGTSIYESRGTAWQEDWREDDFIFGMDDVYSWGFRNRTYDYTEEVWIKQVTPILRPFKIRLTEPEPIKEYTGEVDEDGNARTSDNQEAVASELADSENGDPIYKYDGDTIVFKNTAAVGKQTAELVGAKIVKTNSENRTAEKSIRIARDYVQINQNTGSIEFSNQFVRKYRDYISFANMDGAVGDGQPSSIHRKFGYFNIQPVYEKKMTKGITVNENTEFRDEDEKAVPVKVFINGKEAEYGKKTADYGIGDTLNFTAASSDETYRVTGINVKYYNKNTAEYQYKVEKFDVKSNSTKILIDTDKEYTFVPEIQKNDNKMVIRVREEDIPKFKSTGYFEANSLAKNSTKNEKYGYREIVVADTRQLQTIKNLYLAVEPNEGTVPVWKETNDSHFYTGNSFYAENKGSYGKNIIWLYAGNSSGKTTKLTGSLYYENRSVGSNFETASVLPAEGGVIVCGSASGIADAGGNVETGSFAIPDSATVYDNSMQLVTQTFDSTSTSNYLYTKVTATAASNETTQLVNVSYSGTTQLGQLVVPVNGGNAPYFSRVEVTNDGLSTNYMHMNGIPSTIKARVRKPDGSTEKIKKVELLVLDSTTYAEKTSYEMTEDLSSAGDYTLTVTFDKEGYSSSDYEEGDRLYLRMTTDKEQKLLSDNDMPDDVKEKLKETTYAVVNTGFMLTKTGEPAEPIVQTMDFDDMPGMDNIPLCNTLDANFKLGSVKVSLTTLKDENGNAVGQRIQAGLDAEKFAKSFAYDPKENPNGMTWDGTQKGAIGKKVNKIGKIKGNYEKAKSALSGNSSLSKDALAAKAASFGAKQWGVFPAIGFYMDFGKVAEYDEETGAVKSTSLMLQGGGIYLGASAKFAVNWYAIIPVVYIPCYFGVSGELSFMNTFAGFNPETGHQESPDEFMLSSHNVTEELNYNYQMDIGATVQVYAGIGLCGVLGVRGGMSVSAEVLWYPTLHTAKSYFDETGENVTVTFYMEVDILIGTIQITSWCPVKENWGLLKQYEQFDGMTDEEISAYFGESVETEETEETAAAVSGSAISVKDLKTTYALKKRTKEAKWRSQVKELSPTMMYPASDIENSGSAAMKQIQRLRASFEEASSTLLKNDYDRPDTKLLDMGDDGTLMVFLQNDDTKSDAEFTSLSYVVYKDGEFVTAPVKIQTDKTADFQPDVCDAGNDVIFTWISSPDGTEMSGKDGWTEGDGNLAKYLLKQEIYTVRVPKTTLKAGGAIDQSTIVRLTDDENYPLGGETQFFDGSPKIAYDEASGSYCIYYIKTGYDKNAKLKSPADLANPMNTSGETYSAIVYRIYDSEKGTWVTDDVKSGENMGRYADAPDTYKELIRQAGGQRFLQSALTDGTISKADPLIADFTAFSSQGYAVFAYTVDWDNNVETDEDRDLYIQFYEHATRKSSSPIRVTNDDVADSMPQIVRRAGKTESYVFWKRDGGLSYFNLTDLVKEGLDTSSGEIEVKKELLANDALLYENTEDVTGSQTSEDDTDASATAETDAGEGGYAYAFHAFTVDAITESENENHSFSAYKAAVDEKDNLYIVWIANATDELADGQTMTSQEIFATAMVDSEVVRDDEDITITSQKRWAPANRLTHTGSYCDEPALALTKDGEMLLVYNNYDLTADKETGTGENEGRVRYTNVKTTNMKLKASRMKAVGSIGAEDLSVSDKTPETGEDITVGMRFTNRGLTASKNGFTADLYEVKGNEKNHLTTYTFKEGLAPSDWVSYTYTYKATENTVGSHILVEVKEADIDGICGRGESETFEKKAQYHIVNARYYQGEDTNFYADVTVENEGNAASLEGDSLTLNFAGPYQSKEAYGIEKEIYASQKVALKAGETKTYEAIPLEIPAAAFDVIGRLDIETGVKTKNGYTETDTFLNTAYLYVPMELQIGDGKTVKMNAGDTVVPSVSYVAGTLNKKMKPSYESSDPEIVSVQDGKLTAKREGTVTITGTLLPYGTTASVKVKVSGGASASAKPGKTKVTKLESYQKGKVSVTTKKVAGVTGNQVQLATNKAFTKNVKKKTVKNGKTATFTGLGNKTWYVRSRAYKKTGSTVSYGAYSSVKKFTLKNKKRPKSVKASDVKLSAAKKKLTVTWKKKKGMTGARIVVSTDKKGKKAVYDALVTKKKVTVKKLKRKKTYYVTVRSYKKYKGNLYMYAVGKNKVKKKL